MKAELDNNLKVLTSFWVLPVACPNYCVIFKIDSFGLILLKNAGGFPPLRI